MTLQWVVIASALLSLLLVGLVRRYAVRRALLDVPSERSSHRVPTPRGGGLGVVVACLVPVIVALRPMQRGAWSLAAALTGVAAVAVIGWLDDRGSLPVAPRLTVHLLAGLAVAWLATGVPGPFGVIGVAGAMWWVFWTASAINVTNFMDGIDGLIGLQALVFGGHLLLLHGGGEATVIGAALAGSAAGFLAWNWAPARIFMGDVGSASLGVLMVVAGVLVQQRTGLPTSVVFLPLYPLFLDATVTLFRRWRRGDRLVEAHRTHLYQRLANEGWGHARVSLLYGVAAASGIVVSSFDVPVRTVALLSYFGAVALAGFLLDRGLGKRVKASS
jgi:Fuc2NAc and GlcNAc transferase